MSKDGELSQQYQGQLPQGDYIILSDLRSSLFTSTGAAALTELVADNASLAVGVGVLAELAQRYKRLSGDERAALEVLAQLAQGGSIYKVWVAEDELLESLDHDPSADAPMRLLANMQSRGILEEGAGKWRAVW